MQLILLNKRLWKEAIAMTVLSPSTPIISMKLFLQFSLALICFLACAFNSFAEAPKISFAENKNQWPEQVIFRADIKGGTLFLEKNHFTYMFLENRHLGDGSHSHEDVPRKGHAVKVNFMNSNPNVLVTGSNRLPGILNFYKGNDRSKWASDVKQYGQVHYAGLYPSIDMNVYNEEENLKYDFIVQPGGNIKNIRMDYKGPDEMHIEYGHLYIQTSVGLIIEQKPFAYQVINGEKSTVKCAYVLKNKAVTFEVGKYDHALPLIIDPTLIGSTFTGSFTDNRGYTATYDAAGNMYTGGKAWSNGYPVLAGAYQSISLAQAGWDIVLSKFNTNASQLVFSTYYSGTSDQQPHSIIVNGANELYVAGRTNSTDFPVTAGVFQPLWGGAYDIIVGKFNSTGGLLASTYLGGSADESVNVSIGNTYTEIKTSWGDDGRSEIILDGSGHVYVAANTHSANFPTTAGAYDNTLGGIQDGVVFKMNSALTALNFSTYIGGSLYDAAYGLKLDNSGNIYVTGGTTSADFPVPVVVPVVLQPAFSGTADGFIAVFDPAASGPSQLLRSTYLGTAAYDQSYLIEIDATNDLYVYGQTAGSYTVTAGTYSWPNAAPASGMFIHKITGNLAKTVFSTVIGTAGGGIPLSPTAFLIDSCQTIYFSGWGRCLSTGGQWSVPYQSSSTGLPTSANPFQANTDGCDFYFGVLAPDAKSLFYGTFFGANVTSPDHVDGGTSRFDKRGVIYESVCASCLGTTGFPTTPGAYSSTNKALDNAKCNNAVVKMDMSVQPIAKANVNGATKGCAPFQVCFDDSGSVATSYIWDFGTGDTSTASAPCYTYNFAGTYSITLYAMDSIGVCGYEDTSIVVITVGKAPTLAMAGTNFLCNPGVSTATVTATGGIAPYTYAWSGGAGNTNVGNITSGGTYTVTVTDATGCVGTNTVLITQPPPLTLTLATTLSTCNMVNGNATANAGGGTPGYSYSWNSSPAQTTAAATGLNGGLYNITVTDANGCTLAQPVIIATANGPTVTATVTGPILCNGGTTGASSSVTGGTAAYIYQWSPGTASNSTINGLVAGTYYLVVTDANGCVGLDSINIPEPAPIIIGFSVSQPACAGGNNGSITANANGGNSPYSYAWNTSPAQNTQTATGLAGGVYSVIVTDAMGCTGTNSVTLSPMPNALTVAATAIGSACGPNSQGIITSTVSNGSPAYSYIWLPGGQTSPNISNVMGGTYTVIVTDTNNCTAVAIATMPDTVPPIADFIYSPTISCDGVLVQFTDQSVGATSWYWDFGGMGTSTGQNPVFLFGYNGTYNVTMIVTRPPCSDTLTIPIVIGDLGTGMVFSDANVFTPNNDGLNDCFHPAMINSATGLPDEALLQCTYLEVFDRWGIKMYESEDGDGIPNCWNGNNRNDNKPAQDGTYYYIAKLGETALHGFVTLARHK